jgi:Flp pilus assembly protein TadB
VSVLAAGFAALAGGAGFGVLAASQAKMRDLAAADWISGGTRAPKGARTDPARGLVLAALSHFGGILDGAGWVRRLAERAHMPAKAWLGGADPGREAWVGGKTALGAAAACLSTWLLDSLVFGLACGAAAFFVPDLLARGVYRRRQAAIRRELPDFLDLLTLALEAGLSPDSGMKQVAEKFRSGILSLETSRMLAEVGFGARRHAAWKDMAARLGNPELSEVMAALVQADTMGVGMSQALKGLASQMRARRRSRVEELAHSAPVKLLFPLVFFVFPAVLIVLLGPVFLQLLEVLR